MSNKPFVLLRRDAEPPPCVGPCVLCPYLLSYTKKLVKEKGMTAEDASAICGDLNTIRMSSGRCGHGISVYVAFWGYGDVKSRNTFLRGLRYALRPRVIFASHKKEASQDADAPRGTYFEGVVFFQPNVVSVEDLEVLFERFHMSVGASDLDTYMSEAMVTCLVRIQSGEYVYGNWGSQQNLFYRDHFNKIKKNREDRESRQNVFNITGMHTSNSNMLSLFHGSQNMHIELQQTNMQLQVVLAMAQEDEGIIADALAISTAVDGTPGNILRDSMNTLLDGNARMRAHMRLIIHNTRPPPYAVLVSEVIDLR